MGVLPSYPGHRIGVKLAVIRCEPFCSSGPNAKFPSALRKPYREREGRDFRIHLYKVDMTARCTDTATTLSLVVVPAPLKPGEKAFSSRSRHVPWLDHSISGEVPTGETVPLGAARRERGGGYGRRRARCHYAEIAENGALQSMECIRRGGPMVVSVGTRGKSPEKKNAEVWRETEGQKPHLRKSSPKAVVPRVHGRPPIRYFYLDTGSRRGTVAPMVRW